MLRMYVHAGPQQTRFRVSPLRPFESYAADRTETMRWLFRTFFAIFHFDGDDQISYYFLGEVKGPTRETL